LLLSSKSGSFCCLIVTKSNVNMKQLRICVIGIWILFLLFFSGCSNTKHADKMSAELSEKIKIDERFSIITERAEDLIKTGLNAGDGYSQVWIRDLNTFIETACVVGDKGKIREALSTFFVYQGEDGNIIDGYIAGQVTNEKGEAPQVETHKNTVETDQESSLIQSIRKYIARTGDKDFLNHEINGIKVSDRMENALKFLLKDRYNEQYGLLWGATTADWGDVQPEHDWGVVLDDSSHLTIDIYDNAMFIIAIKDYIGLVDDEAKKKEWTKISEQIAANTMKHLWDGKNEKFIPHIYLKDSPFPADFDESAIYYHGGTAIAIEAGLLSKEQIKTAYRKMQENVKAAGAQSIGLTLYPVYPNGFFKNPSMGEYSYQNGGDWTWFGGRMVQQLIANGLYEEAYEAMSPMLDRVIKNNGFYEWWTPDGKPSGSGLFRGEAGVLWKAIEMMNEKVQL